MPITFLVRANTNLVPTTTSAPPVSGFTRRRLAMAICDLYRDIYETEEATTKIPTANIPGMLNRCETNGVYGIWGHSIEDLLLTEVSYNKKTKTCTLSVDS